MTDPDDWTLTASAFNSTHDVIRAERTAADIAVDIVADGVAPAIEVEAGQVWRGFPAPTDTEARELRERLAAVGGRISIVGASIDDWTPDGRRRTDQERYDFLLPQLRAAHQAGALGVRVPIGQPGRELLERLLPVLHDLDLVLFEEAQGQQTPQAQPDAFDAIAALDDPHVRVLLDISMLMPSLPESYIDVLRRGGVDEALVEQLSTAWRAPETRDADRRSRGRHRAAVRAHHVHESHRAIRPIRRAGPPRGDPPGRRRTPEVLGPRRHRRSDLPAHRRPRSRAAGGRVRRHALQRGADTSGSRM